MTDAQKNAIANFNNEIINYEQFEDMRALMGEDFPYLTQIYITDSQQRIVSMQTAQVANDNTNGFEAAHALKGASAHLGATQLIMLSDELQNACRKQEIGQRSELIEQIVIALQQVEHEINQRLGL